MRIALIHALRHSIDPINDAFARLWPEAMLANLLDDSLSADLARGASLDSMTARFLTLARYARDTGAQGILFTCSAFGPCIEACAAELADMPVLKPNEAMIEEARGYQNVGIVATFAPTLTTLPPEFGRPVQSVLATGALAALDAGDGAGHDRLSAKAAARLAGCDVIALAQFSLARAARDVAAMTGLPVLSTPDSAVRKLRSLLAS
jgi:aspartate/glutamate racemase